MNLASGGPMATVRLGRFGDVEGIGGFSRSATGSGYASSLAYEVHLASVRRFAGGEKLLVRIRDALLEICAGATQA